MTRLPSWRFAVAALAAVLLFAAGAASLKTVFMGKQPDGAFIVSSGQRIEGDGLAFSGRPVDLALHPSGEFYAILSKREILLGDRDRIFRVGSATTPKNAGYRGIVWSPDGDRLFASSDAGYVQTLRLEGRMLILDQKIELALPEKKDKKNPVPGGMAITKDGSRLFAASANRGSVIEMDLKTNTAIRELKVQNLPFEPRLSEDERTLIVSNWGGRPPGPGERSAKSDEVAILINENNSPASGTVSLVDLGTGEAKHVEVGIHPSAIAVRGGLAYVANAMSDSVAEIDIAAAKVARTIPIAWDGLKMLGSMPNALAVRGDRLYVCNGGDNAVCEVDLKAGKVLGFRHAGYFPIAIELDRDGRTAFALNAKGNGSVSRTILGRPGNAHDFQGTVTVIDLNRDLQAETAVVARGNRWDQPIGKSQLKVYNGAIEHVIYIIKENRTYDEVFGDLPQGNGDAKLCSLGETVMPNHRKIAQEFALFDNGYVSGTNSADGHSWSTQAMANDYLEHFYVGYSRSYPDDGDDPMAISNAGAIWDAALRKKRTLRVWGEFCDNALAKIEPMPKDWFEVWEDRKRGGNKYKFIADTHVPSLKPYINREYHYWPLYMSDQQRADIFIKEYQEFSKAGRVPNLMVLSLPCDHGEGTNPQYPTPRAMMADNDLALGRIVEAVSASPQWKSTCIFVVEDDAQSGPDHVDGHRTVFMAISPYTKRRFVDTTFYTQTNMLRSIGMMLGLDPMNKFDALAHPMENCFRDEPDPTPYRSTANNVPLDERNPSGEQMTEADRYWLKKTMELDWGHIDAADPYWVNRINWHSIFKGSRPYPGRPGEEPGQFDDDDDDEAERGGRISEAISAP